MTPHEQLAPPVIAVPDATPNDDDKPEVAKPVTSVTATTPAVPVKETLLVMDFVADGVSEVDARSVTELVTTSFEETGVFDVVSSAQIRAILDLEAEKQVLGFDTDSNSCFAEIAGALGARYVVTGRVGRLGKRFVVRIALLEPNTATTIGQETVMVMELDELPSHVDDATDLLSLLATGEQVERTNGTMLCRRRRRHACTGCSSSREGRVIGAPQHRRLPMCGIPSGWILAAKEQR